MSERNLTHETSIFSLWLNWVITGGSLSLPILLSVYLPPLLIPIICLAFSAALIYYDRSSLRNHTAVCPLILTIAARTLFYSALIMVIISIMYSRGYITYFYDAESLNTAIPFVTLLIIGPVALVTSVWSYVRGKRYAACERCRLVLGTVSERGFIGQIFSHEVRFQRFFLIAISAVLTVIAWTYYALFYINVNINIPDKFFFGWIPMILYLVSVFYIGARCFTIWAYYYQDIDGSDKRHGSSTTIRILIISGNSFYLSRDDDEFNETPDGHMFDTPATVTLSHKEEMSIERATLHFCNMSRLDESDFTLRYMYTSREATGNRNTFHYICCPKSEAILKNSALDGKWYNLSQVERLLHNHELTPLLAAEIHRLYTVTMAWKTYDAEGKRLYKVKHYHPIFRLDGICDWDVDFNSQQWLKVARLNEDKPFFRLRKFWRNLSTIVP